MTQTAAAASTEWGVRYTPAYGASRVQTYPDADTASREATRAVELNPWEEAVVVTRQVTVTATAWEPALGHRPIAGDAEAVTEADCPSWCHGHVPGDVTVHLSVHPPVPLGHAEAGGIATAYASQAQSVPSGAAVEVVVLMPAGQPEARLRITDPGLRSTSPTCCGCLRTRPPTAR